MAQPDETRLYCFTPNPAFTRPKTTLKKATHFGDSHNLDGAIFRSSATDVYVLLRGLPAYLDLFETRIK
jgi:hypothetical protein